VITVNMHEAKSRLSELVKAVEDDNETVILQRHGSPNCGDTNPRNLCSPTSWPIGCDELPARHLRVSLAGEWK
jgi:hypothetical protein